MLIPTCQALCYSHYWGNSLGRSLFLIQLPNQLAEAAVARVNSFGGLRQQERLLFPPLLGQQAGVTEHRLRAVGTQRERLPKRKVCLLRQALLLLRRRAVLRAPGVNSGDGGAQLRVGFAGKGVPHELPVSLEVPQLLVFENHRRKLA